MMPDLPQSASETSFEKKIENRKKQLEEKINK